MTEVIEPQPAAAVEEGIEAAVLRRVLHALRVAGFLDGPEVARRAELPDDVTRAALAVASSRGYVLRREGRLEGWNLTREGREEGERLLSEQLDRAGAREVVVDAYSRFRPLNDELLDLCTCWQLREVDGELRPNDHTDAEHDGAVLARLAATHEAILPVLDDLAGALERFRPYSDRLGAAIERVRAGDTDWFTKPVIDSYHTVWFELHEDLLATLGIERSHERSAASATPTRRSTKGPTT